MSSEHNGGLLEQLALCLQENREGSSTLALLLQNVCLCSLLTDVKSIGNFLQRINSKQNARRNSELSKGGTSTTDRPVHCLCRHLRGEEGGGGEQWQQKLLQKCLGKCSPFNTISDVTYVKILL